MHGLAGRLLGMVWRHEHDVRGHPVRGGCDDERLALRRARGDERGLNAEPAPGEVDLVQLVAVDEPAGRGGADLGVVLPVVP